MTSPFDDNFGTATFDSPYQEVIEETKRAPWWPIALGIFFMAASLFVLYLERTASDTQLLTYAVCGYLLTPLATAAVLVIAMQIHRKLSTAVRYNADSGNRVVRICSFIAVGGFILAIPHVLQISLYFSLLFAPGAN